MDEGVPETQSTGLLNDFSGSVQHEFANGFVFAEAAWGGSLLGGMACESTALGSTKTRPGYIPEVDSRAIECFFIMEETIALWFG